MDETGARPDNADRAFWSWLGFWVQFLVLGLLALIGKANTAAAIAPFAQFPLKIQHKITVELVADQPGSARLTAVKDSILHLPNRALGSVVFGVIPGAG